MLIFQGSGFVISQHRVSGYSPSLPADGGDLVGAANQFVARYENLNILRLTPYSPLNKIFSTLFVLVLSTAAILGRVSDVNIVLKDSSFNLDAAQMRDLQISAFRADPVAAYKLGRYYDMVVNTKESKLRGAVFYYIASCFGSIPALTRLNEYIAGNSMQRDAFFSSFNGQVSELKDEKSILSYFILYNYFKERGDIAEADYYRKLLGCNVNQWLFLGWKGISKKMGVISPAETMMLLEDEIPVYQKMALSGDAPSAARLALHYSADMYSTPEVRDAYMKFWDYISLLLSNADPDASFAERHKTDKKTFFKSFTARGTRIAESSEVITDLLSYYHSLAVGDTRACEECRSQLGMHNIDPRLYQWRDWQ